MDPETQDVRDAELDEALRALLNAPHHAVKVIITTRIAPRDLALVQPGRQCRLDLDEGLDSPYAENILREMDARRQGGAEGRARRAAGPRRASARAAIPRALEALVRHPLGRPPHDAATSCWIAPKPCCRRTWWRRWWAKPSAASTRPAQQVMQALAVYDRPVTPAAVDYLLQPYLPGVDSAPVLNRLVNMHFARKEAGRYYLHPVDRAYAFARMPEGRRTIDDRLPPCAESWANVASPASGRGAGV